MQISNYDQINKRKRYHKDALIIKSINNGRPSGIWRYMYLTNQNIFYLLISVYNFCLYLALASSLSRPRTAPVAEERSAGCPIPRLLSWCYTSETPLAYIEGQSPWRSPTKRTSLPPVNIFDIGKIEKIYTVWCKRGRNKVIYTPLLRFKKN